MSTLVWCGEPPRVIVGVTGRTLGAADERDGPSTGLPMTGTRPSVTWPGRVTSDHGPMSAGWVALAAAALTADPTQQNPTALLMHIGATPRAARADHPSREEHDHAQGVQDHSLRLDGCRRL
jgi:hypothetical protein